MKHFFKAAAAVAGLALAALFLLGMKYGDRVEASILRALRRDDL